MWCMAARGEEQAFHIRCSSSLRLAYVGSKHPAMDWEGQRYFCHDATPALSLKAIRYATRLLLLL